MALENGFHVLSDKPATFDLKESKTLEKLVKQSKCLYGLTHNYTGYPLVKEARDDCRRQAGQDSQSGCGVSAGLAGHAAGGQWSEAGRRRTDPKRSGAAGCIGDIGTHAENLAEYITGLKIKELAADLTTFVKGRKLDDDGNVLLRFTNGAKGVLHSSQISVGEENNLNIRVYGETGGIEWHQNEPNTLLVKWLDQPMRVFRTANEYLGANAAAATRTPASHPEGYLGGVCEYLRELRQPHSRQTGAPQAGQGRSCAGLSEDSGRHPRHGLHRGGREILQEQRPLDQAGEIRLRPD